MAARKGRGEQQFVPVSKDKQRQSELKFCGFKLITKGQTLPASNGNFLMECKLCGRGFQGSQSKAAQHFTIKNNCAKVTAEQLAEIWNKTTYLFDQSHHRKIIDFLRSRGFRDNRNTSGREQAGEEYDDSEQERRAAEGGGDDSDSDSQDMDVRREAERARGKMRGDKAVAEDSTPDEHDDDDDDEDDQGAYLGTSLDGGLMAAGRRGQEGGAKVMKDAVQSKNRKRKATTPAPPLLKKGKVLRQTSMIETFDPVWQREFSNEFLQWWYVSGIPFEAARRAEYQRVRKRLLECPPYTHPALPTHRLIFGDRIPEQQRVMAEMVAAVRKNIAATGTTILTDGRKSITSDQIVNFLAAGPTEAYLFRAVQRDGVVQETAEVVVERWKDVFDSFGVENVNAICTDSASAYVAASKLLAKEKVKYSRITWLFRDGTPGKLGKSEDTIIRARAVVRIIREHKADQSLYRWLSAAHPSSASAVAASSSAAPPSSQRRGRELVYPAQTRFATHYLMLERLLDHRRALEALMMSDNWLRTAWRRSIFLQATWVCHQLRYAPFWEHVEDIVELMTPVMQLLRHLDRGGRVMSRMWSWALAMVDRVARVRLNRTSREELNIVVQACQARAGYVLPWEDVEEETEDNIPPPRDEGVRPAHRVTEAQLKRQVQRGRKDRLSKAPPIVETYFGRRATVLMLTELDAVYDPESHPMAQDLMEAEPWSDPDDLALESEPGDSDDGGDDVSLAEMLRPRTRASTTSAAQHPPPPPPPPPSARPSSASTAQHPPPPPPLPPSVRASTAAAAQHPPPPPSPPSSGRAPTGAAARHPPLPTDRPGHGEKGTREIVDNRDDDDDDDREGYEGSSEDEDDPAYSPRCGRGDDDEGDDGTQAAGGLRRSDRHRADRCSGAGRGDNGAGRGVGGAGRGGGGRARRESASSTHTMHWFDEGAATGEVGAEAAPSAGEFAAASEEVAGGFAEVAGEAAQVGRASAQLGVSFSGILDVLLGLPLTPAGEHGSGDAGATPVSQILQNVPSCSMGDISSSMLQEAAAGTQGSSGQEECAAGDGGDCRHEQERAPESEQNRIDREERERAHDLASHCEMTQSIASRERAERMLETGGGEGHHVTDDAVLECGGAGAGDAGERPASPAQGFCILPIGGAMTAGEFERQASRRFTTEGPAYVPCSPSLPSSTTGATTSVHAEGPVTGRITAPAPAESPSPKSRKKKMRAGKSLSTVRRVTHAMRETQPGLAGLYPRTREALALDVVAETVGWRKRGSSRATEQPITAPAEAEMRTTGRGEEAEHSGPPGRSMVGRILGEDVRTVPAQRPLQARVILESGTDDLEMPRGQRRRASVYDLLRAQHGVDAAPQGAVHAPDTAHGPVGGTGGGDGVRGAVPQRRRKDIVDDDDV
ncbi:hypothetical protein CBR_g48528 [Chara braunii]|uniref:DUF659 domain-containing protein n=1 Tax=Chara braunii TaxID=69332 RepID=A0A388M2Z9_CHABU|nr:hypothetical protein CBR_g48528 [Chara braunii]|eukprot:GBG88916.1 hypothetical protein CBR_g48528 [Chara braunii]